LAQSAVGPGMAVFSRYSKVLESDGNPMSVRTALQLINQELDSYFTEQESEMDKETRFCIAWYEQFGWKEAPFGIAEGLMKAQNTAINSLEAAGVVVAKAGKVRLLKRSELDTEWDPTTDKKLTVWECVQHLIMILEDKGEAGAAEILKKIGGLSEPVKELAYRLYALCEKKGWTEDSLAYNNLIASWQSVTDKAQFAVEISESTKKKLKDKEQKTLDDL
jgi:putative DNA methylase